MNTRIKQTVVASMVEIFKTNVFDQVEANELISTLMQQLPGCRINFDLEDCDKILRIEGEMAEIEKVRMLMIEYGYLCEVLT